MKDLYNDKGLIERLNTIFSHLTRLENHEQQCVFRWKRNDWCPGHFSEIFEPIPGLEISQVDRHTKTVDSPIPDGWTGCFQFQYKGLRPSELVRQLVANERKRRRKKNVAVWMLERESIRHSIEQVSGLLDSVEEDWGIIFLSDKLEWQEQIRDRFGDRVSNMKTEQPKNSQELIAMVAQIYVAIIADYFVGNESNISEFIRQHHNLLSFRDRQQIVES